MARPRASACGARGATGRRVNNDSNSARPTAPRKIAIDRSQASDAPTTRRREFSTTDDDDDADDAHASARASGGMGAPKTKWSVEEEDALKRGVKKYGPGKWRLIQKDDVLGKTLNLRSNVDLKVRHDRSTRRRPVSSSRRRSLVYPPPPRPTRSRAADPRAPRLSQDKWRNMYPNNGSSEYTVRAATAPLPSSLRSSRDRRRRRVDAAAAAAAALASAARPPAARSPPGIARPRASGGASLRFAIGERTPRRRRARRRRRVSLFSERSTRFLSIPFGSRRRAHRSVQPPPPRPRPDARRTTTIRPPTGLEARRRARAAGGAAGKAAPPAAAGRGAAAAAAAAGRRRRPPRRRRIQAERGATTARIRAR